MGKILLSGLFYVTGNFEEFPVTQKGTNVPKMRTRAKRRIVAGDRARHIFLTCIQVYNDTSSSFRTYSLNSCSNCLTSSCFCECGSFSLRR